MSREEIGAVLAGTVDGSWGDEQLAAFLMATAIRGMSVRETRELTRGMAASGEQWFLGEEFPDLVDKHSTGGVGDKVSLILAPLIASCDLRMAKLTGRGLGHTGGTADKLESLPDLRLAIDRKEAIDLLHRVGMVVAIASEGIAPADRRLYALRNLTGTVESLPLIVGSILAKKLAIGSSVLIFDVKTGPGAFLQDESQSRELAHRLVDTATSLGRRASAVRTDMSEPLGEWSGNACEVHEALLALGGDADPRLLEVVLTLAEELTRAAGNGQSRKRLLERLTSGAARERFERWACAQGVDPDYFRESRLDLPPIEIVVEAPRSGMLAAVDTKNLGLLLLEAGAGRFHAGDSLDYGVSLRYRSRLGARVERGEELARLYLRKADGALEARLTECFHIADEASPRPVVLETIRGTGE